MESDNKPTLPSHFAHLAKALKACGDELRLEILRVLSNNSFSVLELCEIFNMKQPGMSHHLKTLATAELVSTRKEGNSVFYRRHPINSANQSANLFASIFCEVDTKPLNPLTQDGLARVHSQRAQTSQQFFNTNASRFAEQQELIAGFDVYEKQVHNSLLTANMQSKKLALEVGPGSGALLPFLSEQFQQVVALDNSHDMIEEAQKNNTALNNVRFICDDTRYCKGIAHTFDCVVANMVLHHTPDPSEIFKDVASSLSENGIFIVCDLSHHDQDWVRDACGDLWLGFSAQDLGAWASASKLKEDQSEVFALRNGFQIQIRRYKKQRLNPD